MPQAIRIQKGYIEPLFKAKIGIKVVRERPSSLGKLRALVESGQTTTTAVRIGLEHHGAGQKLGLIEKIDWEAVKPAAMFPEAKNEYGFGYQYFSTIMAWRKGGQKEPEELGRVLRHYAAFPGKRFLPALSALLPGRSRPRRRGEHDRQALPARRRSRLQEVERDQEGWRGVGVGGRRAAAAP